MPTTIQLNEDTARMLKNYKKQLHADTYDEVLKKILKERTEKSMFGFLGKNKDMKVILRGLRDETDRI